MEKGKVLGEHMRYGREEKVFRLNSGNLNLMEKENTLSFQEQHLISRIFTVSTGNKGVGGIVINLGEKS
jgi:hypothetical protein